MTARRGSKTLDIEREFLVIRRKAADQLRLLLIEDGGYALEPDLRNLVIAALLDDAAEVVERKLYPSSFRGPERLERIATTLRLYNSYSSNPVHVFFLLTHTEQPAPDGVKTLVFLMGVESRQPSVQHPLVNLNQPQQEIAQ